MDYLKNPTELILLVALALVLVIWRMYRQISATYRHVEEDVLEEFWDGQLKEDKAEYDRVANHLTHCEACRENLDRIRSRIKPHPDTQKLIRRKF